MRYFLALALGTSIWLGVTWGEASLPKQNPAQREKEKSTTETSSTSAGVVEKNTPKRNPRVWGFSVAEQSHDWVFHAYPEMSVDQIRRVFQDHLKHYPRKYSLKLARHLKQLSEKHSFDPAFILAVINTESAFKAKVVSFKGAIGLMQILPSTARWIAQKKRIQYRNSRDLENPFINLSIGVAYLASLRDRYNGSMRHFLSAYNAGPARVDRFVKRKIFNRLKTRRYVEKIRRKTPSLRTYGRSVEMVKATQRDLGV